MIRASVAPFDISSFGDIMKLVNASTGTTGTTVRGEISRHHPAKRFEGEDSARRC